MLVLIYDTHVCSNRSLIRKKIMVYFAKMSNIKVIWDGVRFLL